MADFRKQIEEDIREYQENYSFVKNIEKDEWAFNYWVLDKLFYEDEELIEERIIDYHDMGIDAYEIYEDTEDVYLIQNKYYSDSTSITAEYVKNDFLLRAIGALENGTYKKSEELQTFFTTHKSHPEFTVHLQLFVTNNNRVKEADEYVNHFNVDHPQYIASIYYLDDIENRYYDEIQPVKKNITVKVESVNKGTILNINSESYKLANVIDARYVFTPVVAVYRLYRESIEKGYPIFDMNIREYLGNKGVNKNIYTTLLDSEERKNFFYYNNGITVICDKMRKIETQASTYMNAVFEIDNPQIVNGCQTVNSIYEALKNIDPIDLEKEFKDTFVMLKILEIDRDNSEEDTLYHNIVKYNNSQNAIDEKTFVANSNEFRRVQTEFEGKGFLLLIKQSDKNSFANKYKTITKLKAANSERLSRFGLEEMKKLSDVHIPLEKLLQIINAFMVGGEVAYRNKSNMLKFGSEEYNVATRFIRGTTTEVLLDLYLLYKRAEKSKKASEAGRYPIPYYLIDGFAKYECSNRNSDIIIEATSNKEKVDSLIRLYSAVTKGYTKEYQKKNDIDYGKMIKRAVDYDLFDSQRDTLIDVLK
ncbi:MAG: AIPR family protein [Lachnospiraceae bacterium]|nr:AIPR family protein [Lachnospiraceae bacterium]